MRELFQEKMNPNLTISEEREESRRMMKGGYKLNPEWENAPYKHSVLPSFRENDDGTRVKVPGYQTGKRFKDPDAKIPVPKWIKR